jgi:hypothetical protein
MTQVFTTEERIPDRGNTKRDTENFLFSEGEPLWFSSFFLRSGFNLCGKAHGEPRGR